MPTSFLLLKLTAQVIGVQSYSLHSVTAIVIVESEQVLSKEGRFGLRLANEILTQ